MSKHIFSKDFIWGAATSAYQIEGAWNEDGKGESIWDAFCRKRGAIQNGDDGKIACNHYHLYTEDIKQMKKLGLKAYRFSISWPRIFPKGIGRINKKGVEFYRKLAKALLGAGIKPVATLYHCDFPLALQKKGGWANRNSANWFARYAERMFKELGDLVSLWITLNEPWIQVDHGYAIGDRAPEIASIPKAVEAAHNLLLAHGKAVQRYRQMKLKGKIGITLDLCPIYSAFNSKENKLAVEKHDQFRNRWFLDPLLRGKYPCELLNFFQTNYSAPSIQKNDMNLISSPIDFLGVNYYTREVLSKKNANSLAVPIRVKNAKYTEMGWEICPRAFYELLLKIKKDYRNIPIYITENGCAFNDKITKDGKIHDAERIDYLRLHIQKLREAVKAGVPVKGYFVWSLMDNFEWLFGYSKRFGLIRVDYKTQKRTWKDSAFFYQKIIKNNGL
ncbi:MAG: GH1 family beta-glucosidase [Candidatus Micrarchaeota archaeon]